MRVLLVSHRFPPDGVAGVERITQHLAAHLAEAGDIVQIFTRAPKAGKWEVEERRERLPDNTVLYRLCGGEVHLNHVFPHDEAYLQTFLRVLLEFRPRVVHFMHLLGMPPGIVELAHDHGAAVVLSLQDFFIACPTILLRRTDGLLCGGPDGGRECATHCFKEEGEPGMVRWGLRTMYFRRLLQLAERAIFPSRYMISFFEKHGADLSKCRLVENGVSIPPVAEVQPIRRKSATGCLNVAFLGSVVEHKGVHLLVEALAMARLKAADILIAGPHENKFYAARIRGSAEQIPGVRVRFYGEYEQREIPAMLDGIDVVVIPSLWPETFGIVAREALMQGIPIVASRLGGLAEAVVEDFNGFSFNPLDPRELAAIFKRLAEEEGLSEKLSKGARRSRILSTASHAQAIRRVYTEAVVDREKHDFSLASRVEEARFLRENLKKMDPRW